MERKIYIEGLQKGFTVQVKSANRQKRNKYFSNASPCCKAKLSQKKLCSECDKEVPYGASEHKIIKIGKEEYTIAKGALDQVQEQLVEGNIVITALMRQLPEGAMDRFDSLLYAKPADHKASEYKELAEVLKGRVGVGKGVFRNNEYQVLITIGDDGVLRIRQLVEETQRYDFKSEDIVAEYKASPLQQEIVDIERQILDKKMSDSYDISEFRDARQEFEEKVIEDFVLHGTVPEVVTEMKQEDNSNELERLKALMEAQ